MEVGLIILGIILAIFFFMLIKDFFARQAQGEIVIYRNKYDLFFNAIVYILPALVFFIEKQGFDNTLCYIFLCIGFTIFMCVSACDSNDTTEKRVTASIIKIIIGIEVPLILAFILLLLILLFGGKDNNKRNYNRRNRW